MLGGIERGEVVRRELPLLLTGSVMGAILAWYVTMICVGDINLDLSQRELVKHGFAYYTNSPSGHPLFIMKDAK